MVSCVDCFIFSCNSMNLRISGLTLVILAVANGGINAQPTTSTPNSSTSPSPFTTSQLGKNQDTLAQASIVAAGTVFEAKLLEDLSSAKNNSQDRFTLREQNPLFGGNRLLKKAQVEGHLENVTKAARGTKASLHVVFDDIILNNGTRLPIDAALVNTRLETKTQGHGLRNAAVLLGGAVAGHYLNKRTGLPFGTAAGAAAASAYVFNSPGGDLVLHRGTRFKIKLNRDLNISSTGA